MNINELLELLALLSGQRELNSADAIARQERRPAQEQIQGQEPSIFDIFQPVQGLDIEGYLKSKRVPAKKNPPLKIIQSVTPSKAQKPAPAEKSTNPIKNLLDFISTHESGGNYNVVYGGKETPLTNMSIADVITYQDSLKKKGSPSTAVGRYQIIQPTLKQLVGELGLEGDTPFSEEVQDQLATALLKRRGLDSFLSGEKSLEDFGNKLAKEWAALPVLTPIKGPHRAVKPGETYYSGDKINKARARPADVRNILSGLR